MMLGSGIFLLGNLSCFGKLFVCHHPKQKKVKDIVVGGGVSANSHLRKVLTEEGKEAGIRVRIPHISLTNDNAAMIARRGLDLFEKKRFASLDLSGDAKLKVV